MHLNHMWSVCTVAANKKVHTFQLSRRRMCVVYMYLRRDVLLDVSVVRAKNVCARTSLAMMEVSEFGLQELLGGGHVHASLNKFLIEEK